MALTEATIILRAREITGNTVEKAIGERFVPDEAIRPLIRAAIRYLNRVCGASAALKEKRFSTVAGQQDYPLAAAPIEVTDLLSLKELLRSGAHVSEFATTGSGPVDPRTGLMSGSADVLPMGYQQGVIDVLAAQERFRVMDRYDATIVTLEGVATLRLIPCPESVELVVMQYTSSGAGISTLPDECETALTMAAAAALCDAQINRINSAMQQVSGRGMDAGPDTLERLKTMQSQRDNYAGQYQVAVAELPTR